MVESQVTTLTPATHADRHVNGGVDPLIAPLLPHHAQHEAGGADPVSFSGGSSATNMLPGAPVATTWTDLDLSSVVGSRKAFVLLRILNKAAGTRSLSVRAKGNAGTTDNSQISAGTCVVLEDDTAYVVGTTDASGVIQYYAGSTSDIDIYVDFYV